MSSANNAESPAESSAAAAPRSERTTLVRDMVLYSVARLALVVAIAAAIIGAGLLFDVKIPILVAAIFALLIAMPLSLVLFVSLRKRVNQGIAAVDERRRRERAQLEARLHGKPS